MSLDLVVGSLSLGVLIVMLCALQDVFMWAACALHPRACFAVCHHVASVLSVGAVI